jgi:hypothetical protein
VELRVIVCLPATKPANIGIAVGFSVGLAVLPVGASTSRPSAASKTPETTILSLSFSIPRIIQGADFEYLFSFKNLSAEDPPLLLLALQCFYTLNPLPHNDACSCGTNPSYVIAPARKCRVGYVEYEKDHGDENGGQ